MLSGLKVGDKIDITELGAKAASKDKPKEMFLSQVVDVENSTQLKIAMPTLGTRAVPLTLNKRYDCTFYTSKGLMAGEFVVIERTREGNFPILRLEIRTTLKKVQRREYYRYACMLPIKYRIANEDEHISPEEFADLEWKDGVAVDLSGGGMRFVSPEEIPRKSYLMVRLVLDIKEEFQNFFIYADLLTVRPNPNNPRVYECRVRFAKIKENTRDQIISYIFEQERKKRSSN